MASPSAEAHSQSSARRIAAAPVDPAPRLGIGLEPTPGRRRWFRQRLRLLDAFGEEGLCLCSGHAPSGFSCMTSLSPVTAFVMVWDRVAPRVSSSGFGGASPALVETKPQPFPTRLPLPHRCQRRISPVFGYRRFPPDPFGTFSSSSLPFSIVPLKAKSTRGSTPLQRKVQRRKHLAKFPQMGTGGLHAVSNPQS